MVVLSSYLPSGHTLCAGVLLEEGRLCGLASMERWGEAGIETRWAPTFKEEPKIIKY